MHELHPRGNYHTDERERGMKGRRPDPKGGCDMLAESHPLFSYGTVKPRIEL